MHFDDGHRRHVALLTRRGVSERPGQDEANGHPDSSRQASHRGRLLIVDQTEDDTTVYLIHGTEAVLISVTTGSSTLPMSAVRALLRGPATGARVLAPLATSLVLLDLTGSGGIRTLPMPFRVGENAMAYPLLLPDSRHAIIASLGEQNERRIQVCDLVTGQTRDLVALAPLSAVLFAYARPFLSVSPDGRSLLYTELRTAGGTLQEFDLSSVLTH